MIAIQTESMEHTGVIFYMQAPLLPPFGIHEMCHSKQIAIVYE